MNLGPKKDGSPNIDFFQSSESLQGFETVRLWLQKHHKKVSENFVQKWLAEKLENLILIEICCISVCSNGSTNKRKPFTADHTTFTVSGDKVG